MTLSNPEVNDADIMNNNGGVGCFHQSSPILQDVLISDNTNNEGGGVYCLSQANPKLNNVMIKNNQANRGGGIYSTGNSKPYIIGSTISNNIAMEFGGGICAMYGGEMVESTFISDNTALHGGGVYISAGTYQSFSNTRITNNTSYGMGGGMYLFYSDPQLTNTLFSGNSAEEGGGIYCKVRSEPVLTNVTMTHNQAGFGGGLFCTRRAAPVLVNTILWDNVPEEVYFHPEQTPSSISVAWSDIRGGENGIITHGNGTVDWQDGNIDLDPMFSGTVNDPYQLSALSPCVDMGTPDTAGLLLPLQDLLGNPRIFNDWIDMGAYEWNNIGVDDIRIPGSGFRVEVYPNPTNGVFSFWFLVSSCEHVILKIYDVHGHEVATVVDKEFSPGEHTVSFDAGGLPAGVYFCRLQVGERIQVRKLIKL
jgi:predicted outer membrane repeat protein